MSSVRSYSTSLGGGWAFSSGEGSGKGVESSSKECDDLDEMCERKPPDYNHSVNATAHPTTMARAWWMLGSQKSMPCALIIRHWPPRRWTAGETAATSLAGPRSPPAPSVSHRAPWTHTFMKYRPVRATTENSYPFFAEPSGTMESGSETCSSR
jgi:hypothetical protein